MNARLVVLAAFAAVSLGGVALALVNTTSCNYPSDFVPYTCAAPAFLGDASAGTSDASSDDGGDDGSISSTSSMTSAGSPVSEGDGGDGGGSDAGGLMPNGDFIVTLSEARVLAPNGCGGDAAVFGSAGTVTLAQCDDSVDAFYQASAIDGGPFVVDYYNALTNTFLARVTYADSFSNGMCALGPTGGFTPPACTGSSYLCCGSDAGPDAAASLGDAGCGTF